MANKLTVANIATQERVEISNGVLKNGEAYYLSKSEPKQKWCDKYHVEVTGCKDTGASYIKYLIRPQDGWEFVGEKKERKPRTPRASKPEPQRENPKHEEGESAYAKWERAKSFDVNTLFLVRSEFSDEYFTFADDAHAVSDVTGIEANVDGCVHFSADMLRKVMSRLVKRGYSVEVIDNEYKGDNRSAKHSGGGTSKTDGNGGAEDADNAPATDNGAESTEDTKGASDGGQSGTAANGDADGGQDMPRESEGGQESTESAGESTEGNDDNIDETAKAIAEALRQARTKNGGGQVDENQVRKIVRDELDKLEKSDPVKAKKIKAVKEAKGGKRHPLFNLVLNMVVNDRVIGRYPWLFGPAGSGKSTLCKQIADYLGLPFYSVSSLQQKYELEGYTDAVGELVQTVFYKAAKEGGIFLFDEASTTSAEVQVAWNSMLANLWYNFPKVGMVTAHPDFHVIAADNTAGWGGDKKYHARFELDASTLDRYTPVKIDYTDEQDMMMARDDKELVAFMKDVRKALDAADLTYTASPRASKAIKAFQEMGLSDKECLTYGLCGGWSEQDVRIISNRVEGTTKYHKAFKSIVK